MATLDLESSFLKMLKRGMTVPELFEICGKLDNKRQYDVAIKYYKAWLEHNKNDPLTSAVYFNVGILYAESGDFDQAIASYAEAIKLRPDFIPPYLNMGTVAERRGAIGEAVTQWLAVVNTLSAVNGESVHHKLIALKHIGRVLEKTHLEPSAEDALRQAIEIRPDADATQHWISLRQTQCEWPVLAKVNNVPRETLFAGMSPHCLIFHTDDPLLHLARGYAYYKRKVGQLPGAFHLQHTKRRDQTGKNRRIRIGYISSYLREHAHGYLTAGMYEMHDRTKFEVFAYSCSEEGGDRIQARIKDGVDHWVDIQAMPDQEAAQRIFDDRIDILIDFNGYTGSARLNVIALRPAPIIVNWLGYPGSMGTPYHNYLIADDFIIPPEYEKYYSEKVLRLPCYQPNDRARLVTNRHWTRAAAGLPEKGTVFCSFNGTKKITPSHWRRMMSILGQVPDSVLWMFGSHGHTEARLRNCAAELGIAPERLIFAPALINPEHLARYPLGDLFLDAAPCGGHTTASDALWMGVPVLTAPGRGFASRVCGSLVKAAGVPELVCNSLDDYVRRAVELGKNPKKLSALRQRLAEQKEHCPLFDPETLVAHLDQLFLEMADDYRNGRLPQPDFTNMELYDEIGSALDRDDMEMMSVSNYEGLYLERLRERHAFAPIKPDARLWPAETASVMADPSAGRNKRRRP